MQPRAGIALLHTYRDAENPSMRLYAARLGEALAKRGVAVEHVTVEPLLSERARRIAALSRLDSLCGRYVLYPRRAQRTTADVFHIVDHSHGNLVHFLDPSRTVVTCHDVMLLALAAGRIESLHRLPVATRLFRRAVRHLVRAAAVMADSERSRRDLIDLVGADPSRVEVVPLGLNHDCRPRPDRRDAARRRFGIDGPVLLHVGSTVFYKNVEGCLAVLAKLRAGGLDATLVRAGEPMRAPHRKLAERLGIAGAVRDLGRVTADALVDLYAAADVLLFPSLYEGFGWPPLEAMASGVPVVCSNAGSLPEVVGDAARIAPPHDHEALAAHVSVLVTNAAEADEMRRRGLARAALYRWEHTAARAEQVYSAVLAKL